MLKGPGVCQQTPGMPSSGNEILAEPCPAGHVYAREAGTVCESFGKEPEGCRSHSST